MSQLTEIRKHTRIIEVKENLHLEVREGYIFIRNQAESDYNTEVEDKDIPKLIKALQELIK